MPMHNADSLSTHKIDQRHIHHKLITTPIFAAYKLSVPIIHLISTHLTLPTDHQPARRCFPVDSSWDHWRSRRDH